MRRTETRNRRGGFLAATLLVFGAIACGSPQPPISQEDHARQQASQNSAPRAQAVQVTIPEGTEVRVVLSAALGSETSQVGDSLIATTTTPIVVNGRTVIPAGSTLRGRVSSVVSGTKGLNVSKKGGAVGLSFDLVTTPEGHSWPMSASLNSIANSGGKTAGIIGGSAAGGAVLGKILGGSSKDAAIGAVLGGGIGTGIAAGTKGKELKIPAGTQLAVVFDQSLTLDQRS